MDFSFLFLFNIFVCVVCVKIISSSEINVSLLFHYNEIDVITIKINESHIHI